MTDFKINDFILNEECAALAEEAAHEAKTYGSDAEEILWQMIDGHEFVIHTYKAIMLCAECDTEDGEEWLEGAGITDHKSFGEHASVLAFATMITRANEMLRAEMEDAE